MDVLKINDDDDDDDDDVLLFPKIKFLKARKISLWKVEHVQLQKFYFGNSFYLRYIIYMYV